MYAANRGHFTSLKLLIDANAYPDLISEYGETALICAAQENYPDIVAELVRRGANEKIEEGGKTAEQWADKEGHQDVVKIFNKEKINTEMLTAWQPRRTSGGLLVT